MSRVAKTAAVAIVGRWTEDPITGCWNWNGKPKPPHGYGQIKIGGRRGHVRYAHVVVYEVLVGPVPDGHELDHRCRRPICVNPAHLEPVVHQENVLRGTSPAAVNARREACVHGHPFDDDNTYVRPDGKGRHCRTCSAERKAGRRPVTVTNRRPAGPDHEVVSVEGGSKGMRTRPCGGCPWLVRNVGDFPPEAFVHSAPTAYDMATTTFACHEAGAENPLTCAGAALRTDHSLALRMRWEQVMRVRDDAGELHENYRAMAEANGVDPDHPALGPCR